jgi:hypothetical protein
MFSSIEQAAILDAYWAQRGHRSGRAWRPSHLHPFHHAQSHERNDVRASVVTRRLLWK